MQKVKLVRTLRYNSCILSVVLTPEQVFYSLELPWLNNARNRSCIPIGTYQCDYLKKSASGRYRNVYHVTDVPGRSGILIHSGNIASHTKGCILLGTKTGKLSGQPAVLNSRTAMRLFTEELNHQPFKLEVHEWTF